jgi:sigma-B regulation protein RsbU (phosphoserine phosphatase)
VDFVNAGHNPPLLKKAGGSEYEYMSPFHAFVLGARPDYKYKRETMHLEPGDILFLYSDGVTEAMNGEGRQYSPERLQEKLSALKADDVAAIEKAITADIEDFVMDTPASDDVTILAFRFIQRMEK